MSPALQPAAGDERIAIFDVIRGIALLGILLMNILDFGLPHAAYSNLNVAGGRHGASLIVFAVQYVFFEGKMRGLFSLMFGASLILFTERGLSRGAGISVADLYFRRALWLGAIGLVHAYLIWYGDILFPYALCALLLFALRNLNPRRMLALAAAAFVFMTLGDVYQAVVRREQKQKGEAAMAVDKRGGKLSDEQKKEKEQWEEVVKSNHPPADELQKEVGDYRGSYLQALKRRAGTVFGWHGQPVYSPGLADMWAMMLIGMALLRMGVLRGEREDSFYAKMALAGYALGIPINAAAVWILLQGNFNPIADADTGPLYEPGRLTMTLGHLALIILAVKRNWLGGALTFRLAAVGRTALSNYLATSVLCTFLFYGHGLGWFARLERWQLYVVVLGVWIFNLSVSAPWLQRFRFGPAEWCWRSLTYWEKQPMRIETAAASASD